MKETRKEKKPQKNEDGFVVVLALVLLVLLTVLGLSAITDSTIEVQIADNMKLNKQALYEADSGVEVGIEMLEQNIACPSGFASDNLAIGPIVTVVNKDFWLQTDDSFATLTLLTHYPTDSNRDISIDTDDSAPHTDLSIWGSTEFSTGGALQMAAGYEGLGKGAAAGGASLVYEIYARRYGIKNSQAVVHARFRHVVGQEGTCNY